MYFRINTSIWKWEIPTCFWVTLASMMCCNTSRHEHSSSHLTDRRSLTGYKLMGLRAGTWDNWNRKKIAFHQNECKVWYLNVNFVIMLRAIFMQASSSLPVEQGPRHPLCETAALGDAFPRWQNSEKATVLITTLWELQNFSVYFI